MTASSRDDLACDPPTSGSGAAAHLLLAWQAGDDAAFDALVQDTHSMVYRVAIALLRNREDAEDATQEVFWRFYLAGRGIRKPHSLRPWLYRSVVNVARSMCKRRKRFDRSFESGFAGLSGEPEDATRELAAREGYVERDLILHEALSQALAGLSRKEQEVIVLRDIEGLDVKEVASVLSVLSVTVRTHLSRGRLKLREALREMGVEP